MARGGEGVDVAAWHRVAVTAHKVIIEDIRLAVVRDDMFAHAVVVAAVSVVHGQVRDLFSPTSAPQ